MWERRDSNPGPIALVSGLLSQRENELINSFLTQGVVINYEITSWPKL